MSNSSPLADLNAYIRERSAARVAALPPGESADPEELFNARHFRRAWATNRTQEQVAQAVARKPANAGPLNSHALVLDSLALLRELSPDYLRRFVTQVETLQWLEQAADKAKAREPKPTTRKPRPRKPVRDNPQR